MKNKKQIYVLLPTVALVWGIIIYKIITGASPDHPDYQHPGMVKAGAAITTKVIEPYTLSLNYDDPFGKIQRPVTKKPAGKKISPAKKTVPKVKKPEIDLSKYKYQGMIQNAGSKHKIALVMINNEMKMIKEGELIDEFKVVKITKESIQINVNRKTLHLEASL